MQRDNKIREFDLNYESYIQKNESLLIQLCEHIFRSGFVFNDPTEKELEAGEWVIRDFFDQFAEVFFDLVSRDRLVNFLKYLKNFDLPSEKLKKKLNQRIVKAYDQLSKGRHHNLNIRQNISKGLKKKNNHPLYDLLLYIETYYNLVLKIDTGQNNNYGLENTFSTKNFNLEDLKNLRDKIQERLIGRELVKRFLKNIAKDRGIPYENLLFNKDKKARQFPKINFLSPPESIYQAKSVKKSDQTSKNSELKNISDFVQLSTKTFTKDNQNNSIENQIKNNVTKTNFEIDKGERKILNKKYEDEKKLHEAKKNEAPFKNKYTLENQINSNLGKNNLFDNDSFKKSTYSNSYDADVVFGSKKITQTSMENFVKEYPDSALKFILRKNLDGRPLLSEIEKIYFNWEKRGLFRKNIKNYVLKIMGYSEFPEIPNLKILQILREKIYEVSKNKGS